MNKQDFEALVTRAITALPTEFRSKLENVEVLVEDWPSSKQLRQLGIRHRTQLLGLYEGVPQTHRGTSYNLVLPDRITLFQKPIEAKCRSAKEIEVRISEVIRHEIAHHFGIGDATLAEIERQKPKKTDDPR